tara:strand:- start:170 stop:1264 length:1095 start_codon:yes stop_codon:yes gene_type:complete
MKINRLKTKNYSIIIGKNSLSTLNSEIKNHCPKCKKVAIIIDKNIPKKFLVRIKKKLKKYRIFIFFLSSSEKIKNLNQAKIFLDKLLKLNFNRSDLIIGIGGGVIGDLSGFVSSIYKRGINFINLPSTLLAQVDSCVGGKTGVNSRYGKNLIGSFYNPRVVISEIEFLKSLPKREVVCGYAEILKHSIIYDKVFFKFLKKNTNKILSLDYKTLFKSINKSCKIKLNFTEKDFRESGLRMKLNFGHTFAHALEIQNKYSNKLNHGEAVLIGMLIAVKFSKLQKICSENTYNEINNLYNKNTLLNKLKKFLKKNEILRSIKFMKNDKKKDDEKVSFIFLKNIGKTTMPGKHKYKVKQIENIVKKLF